MSIPTVAVTCTAYDQNGNAVAGGTFRARLNSTEIYNGFVVPEQVTGVADASGVCVLQLWPNALGVAGSAYRITAINPDTGQKYLDTTAVVPNSACNLHQIIVAAPYPTVDASEQALVAAQGALAAVTAQAGIATTKAAEASASATTATTQAGIATTQAGTATTQAGIATTQATTATTQADIAAIQAGIATTQAGTATTQAGTATTQAGIATTKASEAAASAATATTQAGTATTQAGVATTKASEAAASATNANNSAYTAGLSVDAAVTAKNQAVSSASAAASSATAASGSATAASTSASSASASASTATTQAGTATTQAGLATTAATTATSKASEASTYASNASASANTATTQAGVATTQAGIATTQAGVATTQAGIAIANANAALSVYGSVTTQQASVTAAQNAATSATASAAAANSSAGNASGSAASALAIYGTTAAQQAALTNAQSAASLAQGYALSASSAIQQDLSGVTAQALHRSPNAVTAMFVYDTSKDSDGGAWTEKCQHTSWYNEPLMGKWLGAQASEVNARYAGATLGLELVANGTFDNATTGWSTGSLSSGGSVLSAEFGRLKVLNTGVNGTAVINVPTVVGKLYKFSADIVQITNASYALRLGTTANGFNYLDGSKNPGAGNVGNQITYFVATGTACHITVGNLGNTSDFSLWDNISVREVTALNTASGDYYQSTVDGKFYRLWKNLYSKTQTLNSTDWRGGTLMPGIAAHDGALNASLLSITSGTTAEFDDYPKRYGADENITQTVSIYIKAPDTNAATSFSIRLAGNTAAEFNLTTGALISGTGTVQPVGNGVYRVSATANKSNRFWFWGFRVNGAVGQGVIVSYPQLEIGSTATAYEAKTTDGSITETFRGNKADFPRLAGIVAETANVTIYDLTEAGRPMWMRFRADTNTVPNSSIFNRGFYYTMSDVEALSGKLLIGNATNAAERLLSVDFVKDSAFLYSSDAVINYGTYGGLFTRSLAQRNSSGIGMFVNNGYTPLLANGAVNAVAMTVLPDAPVDVVSGLQVPTIAVATAGGVSVIKHNGTVVNSSVTSSILKIAISKNDNRINTFATSFGNYWHYSAPIGTLDASFVLSPVRPLNGGLDSSWFGTPVQIISNNAISATIAGNAPVGVHLLRSQPTGVARTTMARIAPTFNTGQLIGDIRRAYLADVDVGSVSGADLVTTTSQWAVNYNTTINSANSLTYANESSGNWRASYFSGLVVGKSYRINFTANLTADIGGGWFVYANGASLGNIGGSGAKSFSFVYSTSFYFYVHASTTGSLTGISITEGVTDRSYKAQAAAITGTLTKSQVALAAQTVSYSGFSAANYLREPYSADLDFGTGEWSASAWVNVPVTLPVGSFPTVGNELITNGDGSAGLAGWDTTTWTVNGSGQFTASSGNLLQTGVVTIGRWYLLEWDQIGSLTNTLNVFCGVSTVVAFTISSPAGRKSLRVQASGSNHVIFQANGANTVIDNITVKEIAPALIADRAHSSGAKISIGVWPTGVLTATAFDGTNPARTVTTTAAYNTGTWIKPEAVYTTDGTLAIRVNGVEVAATRGTPLLTLNNSNAVLTIGNSFAADAPFPGSIALLKLSATVPTAEQSQWMYEQEKQMFRDGAQVTLPDAGSIVDLAYDDATDKWLAVSATNESEWSGLVRTSVTASPAGSYSKISAASGIQLQARTTTNPGVDVTIPSYGLREELVNRSLAAARLARTLVSFDYVGGFTANTTSGSTAIAGVASLTYPVSYVGARISGAGIPANTTVVGVSGTTIYISAAATATASAVQISFVDFNLPVGYEAREVLTAGLAKIEGSTKDFTRLYDGFKETIRFGAAPGYNAAVQIQATRSAA